MKNSGKSIDGLESQKQNVEEVKGGKKITSGALTSDKQIKQDIVKGGIDRPLGEKAGTDMRVDKPTTHRS